MFCESCGSSIPESARFCERCGSAVGPKPAARGGELWNEIRSLRFSTLFPFREWSEEQPWRYGWVQALAFLAFYPVMLGLLLDHLALDDLTDQLKTSAWSLGLYFAVIWGTIFYRIIRPSRIQPQVSVGTFFFTALIGITLVPVVKSLPVVAQFYAAKKSADTGMQLLGYVFGVGLVEESVKALPLYFWFLIQKAPTTPREAAFTGVLSGLGFGVAEAVGYSIKYANDSLAGDLTPGGLLLAHFIRIISLPLLHALWAGVVGYFIGLAATVPQKRNAIVLVGVVSMAAVHGFYDTFSDTWFALVLCLLSLILFIMYVRSAEKITQQLAMESQDARQNRIQV